MAFLLAMKDSLPTHSRRGESTARHDGSPWGRMVDDSVLLQPETLRMLISKGCFFFSEDIVIAFSLNYSGNLPLWTGFSLSLDQSSLKYYFLGSLTYLGKTKVHT